MTLNSARDRFRRALTVAAAGVLALGSAFVAVPAVAEPGTPAPQPSASAAPSASGTASASAAPAVSDAGLAQAILRDLGMTPEQFSAAGQQGKRAADAVASLKILPGYIGISLKNGKITVEGSGPELEARVAALNRGGGTGQVAGEFVLVAPAPSAAPSASPSAPSQTPAPPATASPSPSASPAAPPSSAPQSAARVAASTDQLYRDYLSEVGTDGLQAVAYANGSFVIRTGGTNSPESGSAPTPAAPKIPAAGAAKPASSPSEFVSRYSNVRLEKGKPLAPEEDFFGGQGYRFNTGISCSAGFGAYSPAGAPLVLTAGHCTDDGTAKSADLESPASATDRLLGAVGFSQFGGTNNSWITGDEASPGNIGTDIAVIQSIRPGLDVQPAVTRWAATPADDPANPGPTAVKVIGTTAPFPGQAVCRSGRTDGWSCGTVDEVGIYVVAGITPDPADLRAFRGFLSNSVQSSGGDSGGPWISGNFAVGTHSAGDAPGSGANFAVATTLEDAMTRLPGVQLQLFLNKPALADPADGGTVAVGRPITGQVPAAPASAVAADSKVRITVAGKAPFEVPVDSAGQWHFTAPSPAGRLRFSAETVNGFSHSGAASFEVTVLPADLPSPVVASPGEGQALTAVEHVDGTGTPGATVKLSGGLTGSAVVGLDGRWTAAVSGAAGFGAIAVRAVQTAPGLPASPAAARSFTVVPPAPGITNVRNGQHFEWNGVPQQLAGTALGGARVTATVDGAAAGHTDSSGTWSLNLPAGLAPGSHTVSVTQSVDGVTSAEAAIAFSIDAAPVVAPAAVGTLGTSGQLASTGAGSLLQAAGIGAGVLVLGGIVLVVLRRRSRR